VLSCAKTERAQHLIGERRGRKIDHAFPTARRAVSTGNGFLRTLCVFMMRQKSPPTGGLFGGAMGGYA
jgi:hypothetical protein